MEEKHEDSRMTPDVERIRMENMTRRELLALAVGGGPGALCSPAPGMAWTQTADTWKRGYDAARSSNPYLLDWQNADRDRYASDLLPVYGRWPRELAGTFYRNGPAGHEVGGRRYHHWFDGDGLNQAFHWWQLPPGFAYHLGNAWEDGENVHFDYCVAPDATELTHTFREVMRGVWRPPMEPTRFAQVTLGAGDAVEQHVFDRQAEFPRVAPGVVAARHRYVYSPDGPSARRSISRHPDSIAWRAGIRRRATCTLTPTLRTSSRWNTSSCRVPARRQKRRAE